MTGSLAACVVNFDGADRLPACLGALAAEPAIGSITVVDSASSDASVQLLRERFPEVAVVRLDANRGPAVARNAGARAIAAARVLFVDNDVVVRRGCAARLDAALDDDPRAVLAMPRILRAADPGIIDYEGAQAHWLGQLTPEHAGVPAEGAASRTRVAGSMLAGCFLLDRTRWGPSDPFDPSFPFNYEDHDFGLRCRMLGHRLLVVPRAECLHGEGTPGASVRGGGTYPALRVRSLIRGRWQIIFGLYQLRTIALLAPLLLAFEIVQLGGCLIRGWLRPWLSAVGWMMSHGPELMARRRDFQRRRRVPDRQVFVGGRLPFRRELSQGVAARATLGALDAASRAYLKAIGRLL